MTESPDKEVFVKIYNDEYTHLALPEWEDVEWHKLTVDDNCKFFKICVETSDEQRQPVKALMTRQGYDLEHEENQSGLHHVLFTWGLSFTKPIP